jgi:hypothetical protein
MATEEAKQRRAADLTARDELADDGRRGNNLTEPEIISVLDLVFLQPPEQ